MPTQFNRKELEFLKECVTYAEIYHDDHVQKYIDPKLPEEMRRGYIKNHLEPTRAMYQQIKGKLGRLLQDKHHPTVNRKKNRAHRPSS